MITSVALKSNFPAFLESGCKTIANSGSGMRRQTSKLVWNVGECQNTDEDAIPVSSTPSMNIWDLSSYAIFDFCRKSRQGSKVNAVSWPVEIIVVSLSTPGSLWVPLIFVLRPEAEFAYRVSSVQSMILVSAWSVVETVIKISEKGFLAADMRALGLWMGLA